MAINWGGGGNFNDGMTWTDGDLQINGKRLYDPATELGPLAPMRYDEYFEEMKKHSRTDGSGFFRPHPEEVVRIYQGALMSTVPGQMVGALGALVQLAGLGDGEAQRTLREMGISTQDYQRFLGKETPEEARSKIVADDELGDLSSILDRKYTDVAGRSTEVDNLFKDALVKFSTGTLQPTPEQYAQATSFVDETFTKGAEQQYGRFLDQARNLQSQRAAQMGRQSTDTAYEREFAGEASRVAQDLTNQRGNLIAQRADELSYNRPAQQLTALGQGSQYFNQPMQQAITNRLNLLNNATSQQGLALQRQQATGGISQSGTNSGSLIKPDASLGSKLEAFGSAAAEYGPKLYQLFGNSTSQSAPMAGGGFGTSGGGFNLGNFRY